MRSFLGGGTGFKAFARRAIAFGQEARDVRDNGDSAGNQVRRLFVTPLSLPCCVFGGSLWCLAINQVLDTLIDLLTR